MSTPIQKLFDLTGKTALITGGSRGLGLQMAESLGEAGARILLSSRKAVDLEEFRVAFAGDSKLRRSLFEMYVVQPAVEGAWRQASEGRIKP